MKFGIVNKWTTVNRFVLHTLQRNITHLPVITRKTNIKLGIFKGGDWKRADTFIENPLLSLQSCFYTKLKQLLLKQISNTAATTTNVRKKVCNAVIFTSPYIQYCFRY